MAEKVAKRNISFLSIHRHPACCLLAVDLPFQTSTAASSDVALYVALDGEIGSIRVVLQRDPENSLDVLVSHGVRALTLSRSLDSQSTAFFFEDGDIFAAGDIVDAKSAVGVGPRAGEGSAEAPVGGIAHGGLGEAGWITGGLIRRRWGPSNARAVLEASRGGTHAGSNSQAREDDKGLHGEKYGIQDLFLFLERYRCCRSY